MPKRRRASTPARATGSGEAGKKFSEAPGKPCEALVETSAVGRPARFAAEVSSGRSLSASSLRDLFAKDVRAGGLVSGPVPARPVCDIASLRVVQWNVNSFADDVRPRDGGPARALQLVLAFEPDVVVLQEFYASHGVEEQLRARGFRTKLDDADYPTLLAVRGANASAARSFYLDTDRAASCDLVELQGCAAVAIYATHLHHWDPGGWRRAEAEVILRDVLRAPVERSALVVADFNQPRRCDYSCEEWAAIADGAGERGETEDDGVAGLFEARGFARSLDLCRDSACNWPPGSLPPPTHWTGTAIDYSFARGLRLLGTYVAPTMLSDHFPVVSDWTTSGVVATSEASAEP